MAIGLGKLTIIVGAGLFGAVLAKEGRMPGIRDFYSGANKVYNLINTDQKSTSKPKPLNDSLMAQVNSLRQELQLLASNRPMTIVTTNGSGTTGKFGIIIEIEAAESVYGDDCIVVAQYPPHIKLLIKPRTADVSSQQFVEVVIEIQASYKYPDEPPDITIIDSKGLDEQRQKHLISSIYNKARELSSNLMLVALCEEAVEKLTSMNHPDGDCPLCLSPLFDEGASDDTQPFMKLMSCFHCFHCECIIRWWNWLQMLINHTSSSGPTAQNNIDDGMGTCPVCRKVFHAKDIEHVLNLVGAYSQLNLENSEDTTKDSMLLHSNSENTRREKFEAILKIQQENNGLIEAKKTEVLMPGVFLPRPTTLADASLDKGTSTTDGELETESKTNKPSSSNRRSSGPRNRYRGRNSRSQVNRQWIIKENENAQ